MSLLTLSSEALREVYGREGELSTHGERAERIAALAFFGAASVIGIVAALSMIGLP